MGGTTFDQYAPGASVEDAFREAREQAGYEHGHGGYSGTIMEKPSFTVITHTPLLEQEAYALAEKLTRDDDPRISDKWGPAGAIPVIKIAADATATRTAPVAFDIPAGLDWDAKTKVIDEKVRSMKLKPGESVVTWSCRRDTPGRAKVTATAPKGATKTKYIVKGSRQHATWETGFESQAEARAWATEALNDPKYTFHDDVTTFEVEGITRRVDGQPLVRVVREVAKRSVEVDVTVRLAGFSTEGKRPTGWLFFGWASC